MKKIEVRQQLLCPSKDARGKTRWWWYGGAVERDELTRELDLMREAGIGGVELQIMYPLEVDNLEKGIKNIDYLSPEYMGLIGFAAEEAARRGMTFDLTLGSSWPFGGPFVSEELSGQNVLPFSLDVQGPCRYSKDLTTVIYGKVVGAVLGKMEGAQMVPESLVEITDHIVDKHLFNWPWGTEIKEVEIPEGTYKIFLLVSSDKKQQVLKPLRGGNGLIVDHNRKESLRSFLEYAGDSIVDAVGTGRIQNFFCDSIEVFGHNWTDIIYEEFKKRRGYDLHPYLYALWGEIRGMTEQIRYDFQKTMGELTVENFFRELTTWCHEKGSLSRLQAHGTWGDVLQAYGAADIPEGETFSAFDKYEVNTVHRRLAVSAGHVYHKPIISNESFTWLRFPRFVVSLEHIKAAADSIFLDGINQIVNHGYGYSKEDQDGMLAFYASTNINHTNTWWKYYKEIGVYINRVCDFLQRGEPVTSVAVYLPQHDIWAETPIADTHMCMKLNERLEVPCVNGIHKAGYWFDYVNDEVMENWELHPYDTLLLIESERIPVETMRRIQTFAAAGNTVIAAEKLPRKSCGLLNYEKYTEEIIRIGNEMQKGGKIIIAKDKFEDLISVLQKVKNPDVHIYNYPDSVGYVHRKTEKEDIYFISNISIEEKLEKIKFSGQKKCFCVFDPMNGLEKHIIKSKVIEKDTIVEVRLEAYQSLLFVFSSDIEEKPAEKPEGSIKVLKDISRNWTLDIPEKKFEKTYESLAGWEQEPDLTYYSGEGRYKKTLEISKEEWNTLSDMKQVSVIFEHLGETGEIHINGAAAGVLIKHPFRVDITGLLKCGENVIEVVVTNLLINRMINPEYPEIVGEKKVISQWPYETGALNTCREDRLFNWREREMVKEPLPSGMWGEIYLALE